ncbi:MAG: alpha/beta hydrolase [Acidobacteriia bacterium]|nr:alpha/beta hydrolase [Terriglobia bacterium]
MIARIVLAGVIACVIVGAVYQVIGSATDARRFRQRGKTVRAAGVAFHLDCSGSGKPTVILESGMSVPAAGWALVQPEIARFTRVCSYDRAGYGWSDPSSRPRTSIEIAKELAALLNAAGEAGPYVVTGHSFGGYNVRVFAGMNRADVVGMVLVDASHGDEGERLEALLPAPLRERERKDQQREEWLDRIETPVLIHLGIERLKAAAGWDRPDGLPRELRRELSYLEQQSKSRSAVDAEDKASGQSWAQVRAAGNFGSLPLVVLTAGEPYDPDPLLTKAQMDQQRDLWIHVLQADEARLSTNGRQIVVADSGHMIPFERPGAVVSAIREVWEAARQ